VGGRGGHIEEVVSFGDCNIDGDNECGEDEVGEAKLDLRVID